MGLQNTLTLSTFGTTEMVYVHPTFLYESLWNLLGVLLVYLYWKFLHKKYDGELFIMTFGWYGLGRMFIEGLRMDSLYSEIFGLEFRTSQVLAAAIFIVCLALYIYFLIKRPNKPFFCKEVALAEGEESDSDDKKDGKDVNFTEEEGADENGDAHSTDDSFESDSDEPTEDEEAEYCDKASTEENTEALSSDNEPSKGDLAEEILEEVSSEEPASDEDGDEQPESDTETGVVEEDVSTSDETVDADETSEEKPENNSF
jgi:phosphatidylglycerol:prolipoprotein diacylglycerol transferase